MTRSPPEMKQDNLPDEKCPIPDPRVIIIRMRYQDRWTGARATKGPAR